jgi:hypothetical protein
MNNPAISGVLPAEGAVLTPKSWPLDHVDGPERSMSIERVRSQCRSLEMFGTWLGWGLPVLGVLSSLERLLGMMQIGVYGANPTDWIYGLLCMGYAIAAYSLAGMGTFALSRLLAAVITAYFEHLVRDAQNLSEQTDRGVVALERLVNALETWNGPVAAGRVADDDRTRLLDEIAKSIRASLWDQAATMLDDFAAEYPDDPALAGLREQLAKARREVNRDHFAQLEAAREVNDPDRVFEIYHALVPSLENEARIPLDRELAKWFLTLIHRRLRTGTIQTDVVHLASRFSEVFATTVEGASVRAALPTLRRSVGLCPRCSQPYAGTAEACPKCLTAGTS